MGGVASVVHLQGNRGNKPHGNWKGHAPSLRLKVVDFSRFQFEFPLLFFEWKLDIFSHVTKMYIKFLTCSLQLFSKFKNWVLRLVIFIRSPRWWKDR